MAVLSTAVNTGISWIYDFVRVRYMHGEQWWNTAYFSHSNERWRQSAVRFQLDARTFCIQHSNKDEL